MTGSRDILFFLCLNDRGGAEISMIRLAEGLRQSGRPVSLAVYGVQPYLAKELGFGGEVVDLHCRRTLFAIWPLFRLLRRRRFACLISALTHTNFAALAAAFFTDAKTIVTEHGIDGADACGSTFLFALVTHLVYGRALALVTVSQALAARWRRLVPERLPVVTIYNPVVRNIDAPPPPPAHDWLAHKTLPVVIGIGRLKEEKNFELLMHAFATVQKNRDARLIILGEGEQRAMLERMAQALRLTDQILLPGFVADVQSWLAYADLLASSSKREGFGNVLVEALACGVPVVATDCPDGPAEILQQGKYGTLVPPDDVSALAAAIQAQLESAPDKQSLRHRAGDFTVQACIDAYINLIDTALPFVKAS